MGPASKRLRVIVTRAGEQVEPLARRIEALGLEVVRCPLIELEPIGPDTGRRGRLRLGRRHEPVRRARVAPPGSRHAADTSRQSAPARPRRSPREASSPRSCRRSPRRKGCSRRSRGPLGRVLFAGAERARPLLAGRARRRRRLALPHEPAPAGPAAGRRPRRARLGLRRGGFRRARARAARCLDRARRPTRVGEQPPASQVVGRGRPHDLDGLVEAVRRAAAKQTP